MATSQPRIPPGVPAGGRWAPLARPRPQARLDADPPGADPVLDEASVGFAAGLASRRRALAEAGYVPPASFATRAGIEEAGRRDAWWERANLAAESGHAAGDYPRMERGVAVGPDGAEAFSHRMAYRGAGVTLRMPSVASVRRFAAASGSATFDVPVSITAGGTERSGSAIGQDTAQVGWVRVTRCDDGTWATRSLGMGNGPRAAQAAEAVSALLEARRPTRALAEVGDLLEARRKKIAAVGVRPDRVSSTWVTGLGYDRASQTMVMTTRREIYGYRIDPSIYARVAAAPSPGAAFNAEVKGRTERVEVVCCGRCGRFHLAAAAHRCPTTEAPRPGR